MSLRQRFPSNPKELETISKEEWEKLPQNRQCQACSIILKYYTYIRLEAVIATKGASTKF